MRLRDVPETIGWDGSALIARNLPIDSALNRAREPELYAFGTDIKRAAILADIFDNVSMMRYEFALAHSEKGKKPDKPPLYVTPWNDNSPEHADPHGANPFEGTYGSGAVSVEEFNRFYYGDDYDGGV